MTRRSVDVEIKGNARSAIREADKLAKSLGAVDDNLDDVESAGKRAARAIQQSADDMRDEIDSTARAVERLEAALGPDFDADTRDVVAELKRIGLTAEEIEAEVDVLAAAVKSIDDVKLHAVAAGFDDVDQAVGRAGGGMDRARDATNSFVGNALSEIPGVTETFGPLGEAVGQMTEGLLAGEVKFGDLVKAAGPIAGVTAVILGVTKALQSVEESKAFNREQIESFKDARDAVADLNGEVSAFAEYLREAEALTARTGGVAGFFEGSEDILDDIIDAGIAYDELVTGVERGGAVYDRVRGKLAAFSEQLRDQLRATAPTSAAYDELLGRYRESERALAGLDQVQRNWAESGAENARINEWLADSSAASVESTEEQAAATERLADKARGAREAIADLTAEMVAATGQSFNLEQSELALADAVDGIAAAYENAIGVSMDSEATDRDKQAALRDVREAELGAAEAALATAEAYAAEKGAAEGTAQSASLQIEQLRRLQDRYPDLRDEIQVYIDKLGDVPGVVDTTVTADTSSATSSIDSLIAKLNAIGANVTTASVVAAARVRQEDSGGVIEPGGQALVAERRPEFVNGQLVMSPTLVRGPARVTSGQQTAAQLAAGGTGGGNTFVTVLAPAGTDIDKLERQRYRRTGRVG